MSDPNAPVAGPLVKVLYSPGFGTGWSSWNHGHAEFLLKDPGLVALAERKADQMEVREYLDRALGTADHGIYLGGWRDIRIERLPAGTLFRIEEYDGSESIITMETEGWHRA